MDFLEVCDELIKPIAEHSENVAKASIKIYDNLSSVHKMEVFDFKAKDFSFEQIVVLCGLYHDIGKTYVDNFYPHMLDKEKFTPEDKQRIKQHTLMGAELIQSIHEQYPFDDIVCAYIEQTCLFHHEKINGSGYLKLKTIPRIAQIVTVADVYSAGIEKRPYEGEKRLERLQEEMYSMSINQTYVEALFRE